MAGDGNPHAEIERVYSELRRLAVFHLKRRAPQATLQPTALVNEAWLRLARRPWKSRSHFLALASTTMRSVLVDYVRARVAEKRGGDLMRVAINGSGEPQSATFSLTHVLDVHSALERLSEIDARKA